MIKAGYELGLLDGSFRVIYYDNEGVALVTKERIVHLTKKLEENPSPNHMVRAYSVKARKKSEQKNEDSLEPTFERSFSEGSYSKTFEQLKKR